MNETEAVAALDDLNDDNEYDHQRADQILLEVLRSNGLSKVADAYARARERVVFWYA